MTFVGREVELAWLGEAWPPTEPAIRVIYGRRRLGKSALIDAFVADKRHILYQAVEGSSTDQLHDLNVVMNEFQSGATQLDVPLTDWTSVLGKFLEMADQGPIVVVLDEFQFLVDSDPMLASRLQEWWLNDVGDRPLYLLLSGSDVRFFEASPLVRPEFGRNVSASKIPPIPYRDVARFFPKWTPDELIRAYAMLGGVPLYLSLMNPDESFVWNIERNVLAHGAVLFREAEIVLREELRELRTYLSILRALGDGCTRTAEIAVRIQPSGTRSDPSPYLHTLRDLGIVDHITPIAGDSRRRGKWVIADPYLRFWFRFILPHVSSLEHGGPPDGFFASVIAPHFDRYLSQPAFGEITRSWLLRQMSTGQLDLEADSIGSWWGSVPDPQSSQPRGLSEATVDVIALSDGHVVLAGDACWSSQPVGTPVLRRLRDIARYIPGADESTQLLICARAFDADIITAAKQDRVRLVTAAELFN